MEAVNALALAVLIFFLELTLAYPYLNYHYQLITSLWMMMSSSPKLQPLFAHSNGHLSRLYPQGLHHNHDNN